MAKRFGKRMAVDRGFSGSLAVDNSAIERRPDWSRKDLLGALILILAVVLTYQPVWRAGFIWDDAEVVTGNPSVAGPLGLASIWTTSAADICPLTITTFWAEHALWGLTPLPYHLATVLMHALGAVVLWRVLRLLGMPGAWVGAALWALHPVQAESVAWITEMKNTQSGLFYLLSILFFLKGARANRPGPRGGWDWNYGLTLLCAALAMASKSSTVILPLVLCLCAWWMEGRWRWRNLIKIGPLFLMAFAAAALSIATQSRQLAMQGDPEAIRTWPERLATAGDAVWFYLGKLFWPHPLSAVYPRWSIDVHSWSSYLPILAVFVVLFILWLRRGTWARAWFFVFAYFLVALLPVLGFVDQTFFSYSLVSDHFQYLASMGPLAFAGAGIVRFAASVFPGRSWAPSVLGAGVVALLGMLTWIRVPVYQDDEALWTDTLAKNPDCWGGHNNLGVVFNQSGRLKEAMAQFQEVIRLRPRFSDGYYNLGLALEKSGRTDQAIEQYREALRLNPASARAHLNYGEIMRREGKLAKAESLFRQGLKSAPDDPPLCLNLAGLLLQTGRVTEGVALYEHAAELNPDLAQLQYDLGAALLQAGNIPEAAHHLAKALTLDPTMAPGHRDFGVALARLGHLPEAIEEFKAALQLDPNLAQTRDNLGLAFAQTGRIPEAVEQFQKALQTDPRDENARQSLAKLKQAEDSPNAAGH